MTAPQWYFARGGNRSGPVTKAELKRLAESGELSPEDLVRKEGWSRWRPAGTVKGLVPGPPAAPPAAAGGPPGRRPIGDALLWYGLTAVFALLLVAGLAIRSMVGQIDKAQPQTPDPRLRGRPR